MIYNQGDNLTVNTDGHFYLIKNSKLYLANWINTRFSGKVLSQSFDECSLLGISKKAIDDGNGNSSDDDSPKLKLEEVDLSSLDETLELILAIHGKVRSKERRNTIRLLSSFYGVPEDITARLSSYKPEHLYDLNKKAGNTYAFLRESYFKV